jgi:hypothetical protein
MFPGFIIFALLGPIVPPEMTNYRLELLMTSTPDTTVGAELDADGRQKRRKTKEGHQREMLSLSSIWVQTALVLGVGAQQ